ncbi:MAG: hypothetical protein AB1730_07205 [Myxococcota bacterium]
MKTVTQRLNFAGLSLLAAFILAACVDPTNLKGYQCDQSGNCVPPGTTGGGSGGGSGGGTGGGSGGGSGGGTGGGGGAVGGGSGGGGAPTCDATSCTGCCDGTACVSGDQVTACGVDGNACVDCGSGQRCVGGACQVLVSNGGACSENGQCASNFCANGVCCNSACTGPCERCDATGTEGRCTPSPEATTVAACGDYACDGVNGTCPTTCTSQRQCAPGRYCNANGACVQLKADGAACASSPECASGFCADGVCCNSACTGSCDRCNLAGQEGTCRPAPANDPGSPACGGTVVCNGTLPDCPILCSSGCPPNTFCSGQYCAAKKALGAPCGAAGECLSNFCADGVCCDTACGGACDACSVANGASANGTCTLLGASRVCRAAVDSCDVEERCTGTSADCPPNGFASSGTSCGQTTYGNWSTCSAGSTCATSGTQTRTRTDQSCNGTGACQPTSTTESQACTRVTEGASCGTTTYGAWTACSYADACATTGSRTRSRTDAVCAGGTCGMVMTTETDTAGCNRATNGTSCGSSTFGAWSSCSYAGQCSETGSRTRTRTDAVCSNGTCGTVTATETDTSACGRTTTGQSCGTTTTGAWSTCSYANTCSTSGSRTRTVTTYTCGSGACNTDTRTETDTSACGRTTTGQSCGTTQYGAWSACSYANACSNSGTRTRSVTTYACNASGTCEPSTTTETDTAGCARNTNGSSCGTTQYGSYTTCSYSDTCSNSGSRTRSVTTYTCQAGTCNASTSTETDTMGCSRNTNGQSCGTTQYGAWSACNYAATCDNSGSRTRSVTTFTCNAGTCGSNGSTETDTSGCARNTDGTECGTPTLGPCTCFTPDCIKYRSETTYTCSAGSCQSFTDPYAVVCGTCGTGCNPQ